MVGLVSLLLDSDVQHFLLFLIVVFLISVLNKSVFKYKTGVRFIIGVGILSLGISGFIINTFYSGFEPISLVATLILVIIGLSIMLIKAKKETGKK